MAMTPFDTAADAIRSAGLSSTTERNAMRLLALAHPDNGHVTVTWESLTDLWELGGRESTRNYLTHLSRAGIIHYNSNQWVYVTFRAWPPTEISGVESTRGRVESTRGRVRFTRGRVRFTRGRVESPLDTDRGFTRGRVRFTRGRVDLRVEGYDPTRGRVEKSAYKELSECVSSLTPLPEKNSLNHSISDDEQKRSAAILTDPAIGLMNRDVLAEVIRLRPFEEIRAFCCDLFAEGKPNGTYAGLVVSRIRNGASVPALYHNELYRRHMTPAEIAAEEERQAQAAEEERRWQEEQAERATVTAASQPASGQADAEKIWQMVLADLALSVPAPTFETWVRDTDILSVADGTYTIGVPHAYARDWLKNRLAPQIKRTLSRLTQRSTEVAFAVRERTSREGAA